jgi:hypothetical protein
MDKRETKKRFADEEVFKVKDTLNVNKEKVMEQDRR